MEEAFTYEPPLAAIPRQTLHNPAGDKPGGPPIATSMMEPNALKDVGVQT